MATLNNQVPAKDEFIGSIRQDTRSAEQLKLISGYVGDSSEANHIRVYFDEELNNFIEVNCEDIVYSQKRDKKTFPLGGSFIWVKNTAVYTYGNPAVHNRPKASFLEGDIMATYTGGGGIYGYTPDPNGPIWTTITMGPVTGPIPNPSWVDACPSALGCDVQRGTIYCPYTKPKVCNPPKISQNAICVTTVCELKDVLVPQKSAVDACPSALYCPTNQVDMTIYQNVNRFAAFNPSWVDGCRSAMIYCPPVTDFGIRKTLICPSRLDGCPSTPGGCFDDFRFKTTYRFADTTIPQSMASVCACPSDACPTFRAAAVNPNVVNTNVYRGAFNPLG